MRELIKEALADILFFVLMIGAFIIWSLGVPV